MGSATLYMLNNLVRARQPYTGLATLGQNDSSRSQHSLNPAVEGRPCTGRATLHGRSNWHGLGNLVF